MIVEKLWSALHKKHKFLLQILSYLFPPPPPPPPPFDLHFYSISCLSRANLCRLKEKLLEIWYAYYLLQYLEVQCLRIVTLPCAVFELFPFEYHFTAVSACSECNCHLKSE